MPEYRGECLCGAARYVIDGEAPTLMMLCHCSRCRKETGTIHCATVFFKGAQLHWERGGDALSFYALPGTRKERAFCTVCGSPMPRVAADGRVMLPAGSLDDDAKLEPTAHIFCADKAAWEEAVLAAPCFDRYPES